MKNQSTAYDVLEIDRTASSADIRKAYTRLIKRFHPDTRGSVDKTNRQAEDEMCVRLNDAYNSINTASSRAAHDAAMCGAVKSFGVKAASYRHVGSLRVRLGRAIKTFILGAGGANDYSTMFVRRMFGATRRDITGGAKNHEARPTAAEQQSTSLFEPRNQFDAAAMASTHGLVYLDLPGSKFNDNCHELMPQRRKRAATQKVGAGILQQFT